jgi:hypothetical protein
VNPPGDKTGAGKVMSFKVFFIAARIVSGTWNQVRRFFSA